VKNLVIANPNRKVIFMSPTFGGSIHDYKMMKTCFNPDDYWFMNKIVHVDLGFYGSKKDYLFSDNIIMPYKKQRKSKLNPNTELSIEQKLKNKQRSKERVFVEHSIGGIKSFHCLANRNRSHDEIFIDNIAWLSAGLWNFKIMN
jgi:DDE superfamily endonuclease